MIYELRYAVLNSNLIHNLCGPESSNNPENFIRSMNEKQGFFIKLEKSILKEGFRNPILVRSGWVPDGVMRRNPDLDYHILIHELICDANGGSRLWVAQRNNLDMPCIIIDYNNRFPTEPHIAKAPFYIKNWYKDQPKRIIVNDEGIGIIDLPQTHLLENNDAI